MLLRKQCSYSETFTAEMNFHPTRLGYEAGLVLWWSSFSYASIGIAGVRVVDGKVQRTIVCRIPVRQPGAQVINVRSLPLLKWFIPLTQV